jgi:hypothetical protein
MYGYKMYKQLVSWQNFRFISSVLETLKPGIIFLGSYELPHVAVNDWN